MTIKKIRKALEKIYKERKSWNGAKGPFTQEAIRRRKLFLIKQQLLYQIEEAKLLKNRGVESFHFALYKVINDFLKISGKRGVK